MAVAVPRAADPSTEQQEWGWIRPCLVGEQPRGVQRWNELRASIPAGEGSPTGTQPMEFVQLHRSDQAPVMCLSTE